MTRSVLILMAAAAASLLAVAAFVPVARAQRPGAGRSGATSPRDAGRAVDSLLAEYAVPGAPGASVVVVRAGRVLLARSYGLADVDSNVRATARTAYRLAQGGVRRQMVVEIGAQGNHDCDCAALGLNRAEQVVHKGAALGFVATESK